MAFPLVGDVVIPLIQAALPGVKVGSWVEDIDFRTLPMVNIRRVGGARHNKRFDQLAFPVVEMTTYGKVGPVETEELYESALEALYLAVRNQTQTDAGYLHSIKETFGTTQFSSLFMDSWRFQGLIQLGLRPPN